MKALSSLVPICLLIILSSFKKTSTPAICLIYKGSFSDKPISSIILASSKDVFKKTKKKLIEHDILKAKEAIINLTVSKEELEKISTKIEHSSLKENKKGDIEIILIYDNRIKIFKYSLKTGENLTKSFLNCLKTKKTKDTLERSLVRRLGSLLEGRGK